MSTLTTATPSQTVTSFVEEYSSRLRTAKNQNSLGDFKYYCKQAGITGEIAGIPKYLFYWRHIAVGTPDLVVRATKTNQLGAVYDIEIDGTIAPKSLLVLELMATQIEELQLVLTGEYKQSPLRLSLHFASTGAQWNIRLCNFFNGNVPDEIVAPKKRERSSARQSSAGNLGRPGKSFEASSLPPTSGSSRRPQHQRWCRDS